MNKAILVALATCWACARGPQPEPVLAESPRAPLTVDWVVKEQRGDRLVIVARVNRAAPIRLPIAVSIEVPADVEVVSGPTRFTIESGDAIGVFDTELVLETHGTPAGDLVLRADVEGTDFGAHAKRAYRFGRPAPKEAVPKATGPSLDIGGRDFGPSVPGDGK